MSSAVRIKDADDLAQRLSQSHAEVVLEATPRRRGRHRVQIAEPEGREPPML